ncbi:putative mitochondrial carrier protein [Babesia divergens]|uniref:Mitochondrial carrier protein n=1 Tax=Babesia divergens TaxID=32595 RepID=A0AAD9G7W2_BABDI|nr:putative mitochondrial carrier protein [Babesia divergens]
MESLRSLTEGTLDKRDGITVDVLKTYPTITALSNGLAGAACTLLIQPISALRTRLQSLNIYDHGIHEASKGKLKALLKVSMKDGFLSLYRGATCSVTLSAMGWFLFRYSFDKISQLKIVDFENKLSNKLTNGSLSSIITTTLLHPMWNAKLNLELQTGKTKIDGWPQYRGAIHYIVHTFRSQGWPGLYKGWEAEVAAVFYYALVITIYESMAEINWDDHPLLANAQSIQPVVNGMAARLIPTTLCYPVYVSRTMQLCFATELSHRRLHSVLLWTLKHKKLRGLYAGFQMQLIKSIINGGITFGFYEVILRGMARCYNIMTA